MTYRGGEVAEALANTIKVGLAEQLAPVKVHSIPPRTFNPPAVIVRLPDTVEPTAAMGVDTVNIGVLCAVGGDDITPLFDLLTAVRKAVRADRGLGKTVQACDPINYRNFGTMSVGGADYLVAEVFLQIQA